jgi:hypothetical protein
MTPPSFETVGARLLHIHQLAGVSTREFDRLAGRPDGHFAIIAHRVRKNPEAKVDLETAADYCIVADVSLRWLAKGEGAPPDPHAVAEAIARARARAERDAQHPATGTHGA